MGIIVGILILVFVILIMLYLLFVSIGYYMSIAFAVDGEREWGFATFQMFLKEYNKKSWKLAQYLSTSWLGSGNSSVSECQIKIDGKGMVLDPFSYFIFIPWFMYVRYIYKRKLKKSSSIGRTKRLWRK